MELQFIKCQKSFVESLHKKHTASGAFLFNEKNQVLIIRQSYRDYWSIPGGISDLNESPFKTLIREVKEETNLNIQIEKLAIVDYQIKQSQDFSHDKIQFIFTATCSDFSYLRLDNKEIIDAKFVEIYEAKKLLKKNISLYLDIILENQNTTILMENSKKI
ncbi:hypothetical protein CL656_06975 [bacterium]|nr:hypothetical protein [bacterium]